MFGFFKKKKSKTENNVLALVSPVNGKTLPLCNVPDPVLAEKIAGDGIAIIPEDNMIVAPTDGELTLVSKTKHAFAMTTFHGVELLIHVGLETVSLNGEGFEQLTETGSTVTAGTPILKIDKDFIKSKNLSLITPVLITNPNMLKSINPIENITAVAGETSILEYTV